MVTQHVNAMWQRFRPFATAQFIAEFPRRTEDRLWEMVLAIALLDHGLPLEPQPDDGPDLGFAFTDGQRVWIEAVRVGPGDEPNEDRVPELRPLSEVGMAQLVPEEQIILRFIEALDRKRRQWRRRIARGVVSPSDIYVIAMNGGGAQSPMLHNSYRFALKALFGLGPWTVEVDVVTRKAVDAFHEPRPTRKRANGKELSSSLFLSSQAVELSAVICSDFHAGHLVDADWTGERASLICIHNPYATVPLPRAGLPAAREYGPVEETPD